MFYSTLLVLVLYNGIRISSRVEVKNDSFMSNEILYYKIVLLLLIHLSG